MYNKEDFDDQFGTAFGTKYLIDTVIKCQKVFATKSIATREELIGLGDSWVNMACIDKLEDLGYIYRVSDHEVSNYITYRNGRL